MPKVKKESLKMLTEDGCPMVEIFSMKFQENKLILDAKALDSMRMNVIVTPEAIAEGWSVITKNKKALFSFAKGIPSALRKQRRTAALQ